MFPGCQTKLDIVVLLERSDVTAHYIDYIKHFLVKFVSDFDIGADKVGVPLCFSYRCSLYCLVEGRS